MKLLSISDSRDGLLDIAQLEDDARPIKSIHLSLTDAEIFFDHNGNAKLMVKDRIGTRLLDATAKGPIGYWKATDDDINTLQKNGYVLPDWRNLTVASIAELYPKWSL